MHQSWLGAVTSENSSEYGVVRRFFRFGLVKPARLRMLPNVLAAGQSTLRRPAIRTEIETETRAHYRPSTYSVHLPTRFRFVDTAHYYRRSCTQHRP
jgi:hypothetical protein